MQTKWTRTSGDLTADRRFSMAMDLAGRGDVTAAIDLLQQTVECTPDWPVPYFRMGELYQKTGDHDKATTAFRQYLQKDNTDRMGAVIKLSLLGVTAEIANLPPAYVASLFDQYAPRFDVSLVEKLSYKAPQILFDLLKETGFQATSSRILDLGCGTGLAAELFIPDAAWIEGVDLSQGMVAEAQQKKLYNALHVGDVHTFLRHCPSETRYHMVMAADVLVYMGDLLELMNGVSRVLQPGGLFAFTCQKHDGEGYVLGSDHRFAHSQTYLEEVIASSGMEIRSLKQASPRQDGGHAIDGWACLVEKPSSRAIVDDLILANGVKARKMDRDFH